MKKGIDLRSQLPLADMHVDGVRFDVNVLKALQRERAWAVSNPESTSGKN
ncbi:hypothetical protein [Muriicola marianensis]|nr:hypothetical protein [Muriicola marianensis]